jgi:hypothetical protein
VCSAEQHHPIKDALKGKLGSEKSREVTFERSLRGGAWTDIQVVLEAVPPNQLGFVRLSDLSHKGITLTRY